MLAWVGTLVSYLPEEDLGFQRKLGAGAQPRGKNSTPLGSHVMY